MISIGEFPFPIPDAGDGACCDGAAVRGPRSCTCWEPVYDAAQSDELQHDVWADVRPSPCDDCAFRGASPERTGDDRYAGAGMLDDIAAGEIPFRCHEGMRRIVALVHRETGHRIDLSGLDYYDPPVTWRPYRTDGQPALLCAGWSAAHARHCTDPTSHTPTWPPFHQRQDTEPCPPPSA